MLRPRASGAGGRSPWRRSIELGLVNALGIYTHFAHAFVVLTQAALVTLGFGAALFGGRMAAHWRRWRQASLAHLITLILFIPWLPTALAQLGNRSHRLQRLPVDAQLGEILGFLAYGKAYELSLGAEIFIVVFLLVLGLLPLAKSRADWRTALLPIAWVAVSIAGFVFAGVGNSFLRFLLPAQLALALWLGRGLWVLWALPMRRGHPVLRAIPRLAAVLVFALYLLALLRGLHALYHHPDFQRDDMRGLAGQIEADLGEGDAVIVSAPGLQELLRYYYQADAPVYPLPRASNVEAMKQEVLDIIAAHDRLHVIFYGAEQQDPNLIVEKTLNH